jgi:hypothetical protein
LWRQSIRDNFVLAGTFSACFDPDAVCARRTLVKAAPANVLPGEKMHMTSAGFEDRRRTMFQNVSTSGGREGKDEE